LVDPSDVLLGKILIVDDNPANVLLLERMLRRAGYAGITTTHDPHRVCDLHRENGFDLVLLDLQMPDLDGFRVLKALKRVEGVGEPSVLVMTAHPGNRSRAIEGGATDFVSKPFDAVEVLSRVYNLMELRLHESQSGRQTSSRPTGAPGA
jgi:DNA-binding response OmpR family regulator